VEPADLKLLAEFGAGKRRATDEVVDRMRPAIWRRVVLHWRDLKDEAQDLQGEAFALLVRWTNEKHDFSNESSLETLASRLADQTARALRWSRARERALAEGLANEPDPPADSAEDRIQGARTQERLLALLDRLPREQTRVIHAAARAATGGPSLDRVLRVSAEKARFRLLRARLALVALARAEGFSLSNPVSQEAGDE
jgi:DNA-directed RNA polymerase specialized sigma24 family protein